MKLFEEKGGGELSCHILYSAGYSGAHYYYLIAECARSDF